MPESRKHESADPRSDAQAPRRSSAPSGQPRSLYPGLPTGTGLGKYRILERVGTTHNAIVYRARDAILDRLVAIKQMIPELIDDPVACGHFKREAQCLARIPRENPNLIGIHELIEDDLGIFIVEEYVRGQWLESLIAKRRIDLAAALRILKVCLSGLQTLHKLDVVHRGIHPGNIIIARTGRAKIGNLASAAHESDPAPPPVIVPKYSAPELLAGAPYDDRVDIYSLGMVLFEMCVGRVRLNRHFHDIVAEPQSADDRWVAWHTDMRHALPNATTLNRLVPPRLSEIIQKMTAKDLDERFASISEVLETLAPQGTDLMLGGHLAPRLPAALLPDRRRATPPPGHLLHDLAARGLDPTGGLARPTLERTSTQTVALPTAGRPASPAALPALVPAMRGIIGPAAIERLSHRRRRRRAMLGKPIRPPRIDTIPTLMPVAQTVKPRRPHLMAWAFASVAFTLALGVTGGLAWYYYFGPGLSHPIESVVAEARVAYDEGRWEAAHAKCAEAMVMQVRRARFEGLRHQAIHLLMLVEAEQALADNDFDTAEAKLREAQRGGADPSAIEEVQWRIWNKKDAYRLAIAGIDDMNRGDFTGAEMKLNDYEKKARAAGLDPTHLGRRLEATRRSHRFTQAFERAKTALAEEDFDAAKTACRDARRVADTLKAQDEIRGLYKQIGVREIRSKWVFRGDEAMLRNDFPTAADAYAKANRIQTSKKIEEKARLAGALADYDDALEILDDGDLLEAERHLRSSMWKFATKRAETKLTKLTPAFEAARIVRQADLAMERGDFDKAKRLYEQALPALPPPADAIAKEKAAQARRAAEDDLKKAPSSSED